VQNVLYPNVEPLEVKSAHIKSTRSVDAIHARCGSAPARERRREGLTCNAS
jgi:hypothetical protein